MKTTALVVSAAGVEPRLQEVTLDEIIDDEVLLEVVASGLCHTDLALGAGRLPGPFPAIMGHEGSGKVLRVGASVKNVQVGDSVLCAFASCGSCRHCTELRKPTSCDSACAADRCASTNLRAAWFQLNCVSRDRSAAS